MYSDWVAGIWVAQWLGAVASQQEVTQYLGSLWGLPVVPVIMSILRL